VNDTIVLYRQPELTWPDGMRSREQFVAVILHRKPFEPVQPNRAPDAGSDRTVYAKPTREEAIRAFENHDPSLWDRCGYTLQAQRCTLADGHDGPHRID
jgi:hypothetical protein